MRRYHRSGSGSLGARLGWAGVRLLLLAGLLGACQPPAASGAPTSPAVAGVADAQSLPAFASADEVAPDGEPERFYVELGDAPFRGPADAPITIVMFSDFECPYCERGYETLRALRERYPETVRVAYKAYPLDIHSRALVAAMAARSAQAHGKFWEYHDLLFGHEGLELPKLLSYAERVGLDPKLVDQEIESLRYGPAVRREMRQGRRIGVSSTPMFFVNGRPVAGAKPVAAFETIISDELERIDAWKSQGVSADGVYEHAIAEGYREVVYTQGRGLDPDSVFPVPIDGSPTLGPSDAPVTVVVFGDFECPFCVRGEETLLRLREFYGDRMRLAYKHHPLPFHSHAFVAARASIAAGAQGKFWEYHDALYAREARFDEQDLVSIAKQVGLDKKLFVNAMNSTTLDARIESDLRLAMALGVTGTPAFFVNGRPIEGALPDLQFRLLIEEELERAKLAREAGVAPSDLYETLTHTPLDE